MKSILVVDDNKLNLATARTVLSDKYRVIPVMKGQQALTFLERGECDLILLDINMPEMDGFEVLKRIREMERCRNMPVIFLTADDDAETETRCFKEGAVDFIAKPFVPEIMLSRIGRALELDELRRSLADRLKQKTREVSDIKSKSQQDALTGLWDRAYTEETVNRMLERGIQGSLMMLDIDNFKSVNDTYGHAAGDSMIQMLADVLRKFSSKEDVLCRIGGDEFMVFVKNVTLKAEVRDRAAKIISEMNNRIDECGFDVGTSISIGISQAPEDGNVFAGLYNCADKALYYVKRNGKNSYHFFGAKLQDENEHGRETVDLQYLQEFMCRADSGNGAYQLNVEGFQHVYNFIRRFVDNSKLEVTLLLFTISETENEKAIEALEKTACTFLRRSDVATRYSNRQLIATLPNATDEDTVMIAERIIENFNNLYTEGTIHIDYSISHMNNRSMNESSDSNLLESQ